MLPTLEEIESANERVAREMPLVGMQVGEQREVVLGDEPVQVRRVAVS